MRPLGSRVEGFVFLFFRFFSFLGPQNLIFFCLNSCTICCNIFFKKIKFLSRLAEYPLEASYLRYLYILIFIFAFFFFFDFVFDFCGDFFLILFDFFIF